MTAHVIQSFSIVCIVAQAYLDLNCFEEAERDATTALESDPDNLKASYRRGRARFSRYKPDKRGACMDLCRVVSKDPNNEQARTPRQ